MLRNGHLKLLSQTLLMSIYRRKCTASADGCCKVRTHCCPVIESVLKLNQSATTLAQSTITMSLSQSQVSNRKAKTIRCTREMPHQVAIALSVHNATRSKKIINVLHDFGVSIEYNRLLRIESQIADAILSRLPTNDNIHFHID